MGLFDIIKSESSHPECGVTEGMTFQSKSLYAAGGEFTITSDGKLIEHQYRYESNPDKDGETAMLPLLTRIPIGDCTIAYHGDILLVAAGKGDPLQELVARFTHGRLEWIRALSAYPAENRAILTERGAR